MKLIVKPHSGLANRIRVMVSALMLAKKLNYELEIIWEKDKGLNCSFEELFSSADEYIVAANSFRVRLLDILRGRKKILLFTQTVLGFRFIMFDHQMKEYVWSTGSDYINLQKIPEGRGDIYINSCHAFYFNNDALQYFQPTPSIMQRVKENTREFSENTIGVHIRRTDNEESIKKSSFDDFRRIMLKELEQNNNVNFYLASDDLQVKEDMQKEFGSKVKISDFNLMRSSEQGIKDALVELFSLARTSKIYGSYWSSYSDIAARIGSIPLIIAQNELNT